MKNLIWSPIWPYLGFPAFWSWLLRALRIVRRPVREEHGESLHDAPEGLVTSSRLVWVRDQRLLPEGSLDDVCWSIARHPENAVVVRQQFVQLRRGHRYQAQA